MSQDPKFETNPDALTRIIANLKPRMGRAVEYAKKRIGDKLSHAQEFRWAQPRTEGRQPYKVGLGPSKPGEPPKLLTGRLRDSLTGQVTETATELRGEVGTNTAYGRALELGDPSRGLAPRPHLRNTVIEEQKRILSILETGE